MGGAREAPLIWRAFVFPANFVLLFRISFFSIARCLALAEVPPRQVYHLFRHTPPTYAFTCSRVARNCGALWNRTSLISLVAVFFLFLSFLRL